MISNTLSGGLFGQQSQQPQQNQYLSKNPMTSPDANTSWMSPTNMSQFGQVASSIKNAMSPQTNGLQNQTQPRTFQTSGQQVNQNIGASNNGTALSAISNGASLVGNNVTGPGSYNGNTGITGSGSNWIGPSQSPSGSNSSTQPQQSNQSVNLPGWDSSRTDNSPKQVFGQFAQNWQNSGKQWGPDAVRAFVAQDPRWEIDPNSSPNDPHVRVKQDILNTWKPGTSIYQDVIRDSGPGGANAPQFWNVFGDPSMGYAAPGSDLSSSGASSPMIGGSTGQVDQNSLSQLMQRIFSMSQQNNLNNVQAQQRSGFRS